MSDQYMNEESTLRATILCEDRFTDNIRYVAILNDDKTGLLYDYVGDRHQEFFMYKGELREENAMPDGELAEANTFWETYLAYDSFTELTLTVDAFKSGFKVIQQSNGLKRLEWNGGLLLPPTIGKTSWEDEGDDGTRS